jgi:5-methylcytosine-specific restriction endonuclease McrA
MRTRSRLRVFEKTDGCCLYCNKQLATDLEADIWVELGRNADATPQEKHAASRGHCSRMQVDHFIPRSMGGEDCLENYAPACTSCNASKRHHHPAKWLRAKRPDFWAEIVDLHPALEDWGRT